MGGTVIKVENLSKQYRLGEIGTGSLSHDISRWVAIVRGKDDPLSKIRDINDRAQKGDSRFVWALKDINFEVKQGDVLGIIGRNGAGKSTLLKVLTKVTKPTTGTIKLRGRIASLLEVGTGFHPELTGRENVFLNGAILGMNKAEIKSKFDEIVDFAGVERYIDTPVKRYSSGMYVRLAFAVAAHLEPEILIVDEVLAVGDAEFQKKCLGKMNEASKSDGRTILFVSHNMASMKNLCSDGLLLANGNLIKTGDINSVIDCYLTSYLSRAEVPLIEREDRKGNAKILFTDVRFRSSSGRLVQQLLNDEGCSVELSFETSNATEVRDLHISISINNIIGQRITYLNSDFTHGRLRGVVNGKNWVEIRIPKLPLVAGEYTLTLFSTVNGKVADWIDNACRMSVENGDFFGRGKTFSAVEGFFLMEHSFFMRT